MVGGWVRVRKEKTKQQKKPKMVFKKDKKSPSHPEKCTRPCPRTRRGSRGCERARTWPSRSTTMLPIFKAIQPKRVAAAISSRVFFGGLAPMAEAAREGRSGERSGRRKR